VVYADGPDGPLPDPSTLGLGEPSEVMLGWVVRQPSWLDDNEVPVTTFMSGLGTRRPVGSGRVRAVATRLSAVPGLLAGRLRPDVAVIGAVETTGGWRVANSPGFTISAARAATTGVIIERWPADQVTAVDRRPRLPPISVIDVLDRRDPPDPPQENRLGPEHAQIGRLVAGLIPDDATVQWGPGAVGASVVAALDRPVAVHSGLVTEELVELENRGLLARPAVAGYLWGGVELAQMVASGRLLLRDISETHDLSAISAIPRFVAINTALQVGLDGAANVETVGGRVVSGPGGHPDFAAGASRSAGGISVVALPATAGGRSNIVARPDVVSTPRADVDVVVTEYGIADLRGATVGERRERMAAIAAPEHRAELGDQDLNS
jgi:acyl-CoA hydrolase